MPKTFRAEVDRECIDRAFKRIRAELNLILELRSRECWVSSHEILGILTEEYHEMIEAVHKNDIDGMEVELTQIGVIAVFALASRYSGGMDR